MQKPGNTVLSADPKRFEGIKRDYTEKDVEKLRGTFDIEHTLSKTLSEKLSDSQKVKVFRNVSAKKQLRTTL